MWNKTGHILSTIFWGIFLAYLIDPLSSWFQNLYETRVPFLKKSKKGSRIFAVLSSLFFFLSLVTLGITLFSMNVFSYFQEVSWEDFTEKINGMGADTLIALQSCNLPRAYLIFLNQCVLRDASLFHHIPQIIVRNHSIQASLSA